MPKRTSLRGVSPAGSPGRKLRLAAVCWLSITAGLLAPAARTRAQLAARFDLQWSAPDECPDRDSVLRLLRRRLPDEQLLSDDLRVRARIVRHSGSYRLELVLRSSQGEAARSLVNAQCEPLAEAAAVLLALAIAPEATAPSPALDAPEAADTPPSPANTDTADAAPTSRDPAQVAPSKPANESAPNSSAAPVSAPTREPEPAHTTNVAATEPEPEPEATPAPRSRRGSVPSAVGLQLSAAARASTGVFPFGPALGVQAQLELRVGRVYAAAGVSFWPEREQRSGSYPDALLRGSGVFSDLSLGLDLVAGRIGVTPALSMELGKLDAAALDIDGPESGSVLWLATGVGAVVSLRALQSWRVALELTGLVPIFRTRWLVRTPQAEVTAFTAAPVGLRISLRIGYAFW